MVYGIDGISCDTIYNIEGNSSLEGYTFDGKKIFPDSSEVPNERILLFEDNFEELLNESNWSYEIGNVRNNELQFYRSQNVSLQDSNLVITAKKEPHLNKTWTSGSITGQKKRYWKYGRFEAKIKFPGVAGAFGAFWALGANHWIEYKSDDNSDVANSSPEGSVPWPQCGEIDIIETIPGNTNRPHTNLWRYNGGSLGSEKLSFDIDISEWHIYSMEWTSEYIAMEIDGIEFKRWNFSDYTEEQIQAYRLPQYIVLNLAVGASGGTPPTDVSEMKMYVDWVRVYEPKNISDLQ